MSKPVQWQGGPLVSVVMPVYNAERYVAAAIDSILAQTYPHLEFIIVDDGSTDGSAGIVCDYAAQDARIRVLSLEHGGIARAANAGVTLAQGELIARMDADDIALPERLAVQLGWMRRAGVDICGSCAKRFGAEDGLLWLPETHAAIRHELLFRIGLLHATVLMYAHILKAHPYDERTSHEDYEMWTRLALLYRMGNVPQVLLKRRCHVQQAHVVQSAAFRMDRIKFRCRYFHKLFPQATEEDCAAVARVAENEPLSDLADLERAGGWLVRLAQMPDALFRQRMADRWRAACQRSAHLGLGCYCLYRQIAPQFGVMPGQGISRLYLTCALRLRSGSRPYTLLAQAQRAFTRFFRRKRRR